MNSTRSQIVDLEDPALAPSGWDTLVKPPVVNPEDITIYEIHMRDFSVNDPLVPAEAQGTFKAFTYPNSNGMQHLQALADAGLSHLHLLPVFDIATINEDKSTWQEPDFTGADMSPASEDQQAAVTAVENTDAFNWGYDPFHYTVPEGSYSTVPTGTVRIVEFREMVQAINQTDLRVVMDVVYNHTNASGQNANSVLDKVVPGYYHRLNGNGQVETSTCCENTATEHEMMEKLMVDSLVTWAKAYKVDAFRFDLMGHHMKDNMLAVRAALDALTLEDDGVDGAAIYLYGEGWDFGEVANNARGVNATQFNMAGTGIGTFSDRLRDAVRGPSPFASGADLMTQGFANGLYYDPNNHPQPDALNRLLLLSDQIRVGLAGNLADYEFIDRHGNLVTGAEVDYNGQPAGYTADPQEHIVYISKHDNQTLYDINAFTIPTATTTMTDRVRVQQMGLEHCLLEPGCAFLSRGQRSTALQVDGSGQL
ncbi:MAG: pullulanase-type alpha-1,6-glucosidase [Chloroflexi bacterium]|nr:pullulanase-type alpha-1,6-glucosidase [Chloroflexota bacterium]